MPICPRAQNTQPLITCWCACFYFRSHCMPRPSKGQGRQKRRRTIWRTIITAKAIGRLPLYFYVPTYTVRPWACICAATLQRFTRCYHLVLFLVVIRYLSFASRITKSFSGMLHASKLQLHSWKKKGERKKAKRFEHRALAFSFRALSGCLFLPS